MDGNKVTSTFDMNSWTAPELPDNLPQGDMPGDIININEEHIKKAGLMMKPVVAALTEKLAQSEHRRCVLSVYGGSGVGKSEIASLLSYYLGGAGIPSYVLSGDNYPHRVPVQNDLERLRVFRTGGLKGLVAEGLLTEEISTALQQLWQEDRDALREPDRQAAWLKTYQDEGRSALMGYLGTEREIDFCELNRVISSFKNGADSIYLKRMGRSSTDLWYDRVDFRGVSVLLIEWTHGNSGNLQGVDLPIFLHSTPDETLAHRRARGRDKGTDSAFTTMVLDIEQNLLVRQADSAFLIVAKSGEILDKEAYLALMRGKGGNR